MKVQNKIIATSIVACTLLGSQLSANTHCTNTENVVFSCNTGKKIVSICASKNLSAKSGYIQYRFGKLDSPESLVPQKLESFRNVTSAYLLNIGGSAEARGIEFKNGNFLYGINVNDARLYVRKNGNDIAELMCKQDGAYIDNFEKYNFQKIGLKVEEF